MDALKDFMTQYGEKMHDHEVADILQDMYDLIHEEHILIDDLANYLMGR